jgi:hypothetical protein
MAGEVSGIILVGAFALAATLCAMLMRRLWRFGSAEFRSSRDS